MILPKFLTGHETEKKGKHKYCATSSYFSPAFRILKFSEISKYIQFVHIVHD